MKSETSYFFSKFMRIYEIVIIMLGINGNNLNYFMKTMLMYSPYRCHGDERPPKTLTNAFYKASWKLILIVL